MMPLYALNNPVSCLPDTIRFSRRDRVIRVFEHLANRYEKALHAHQVIDDCVMQDASGRR